VSLKTAGPHSGAPSFREGPARLLQAIEQDTGQNIRGVRTLSDAQDIGRSDNTRGENISCSEYTRGDTGQNI
jgi:hypothetical protein